MYQCNPRKVIYQKYVDDHCDKLIWYTCQFSSVFQFIFNAPQMYLVDMSKPIKKYEVKKKTLHSHIKRCEITSRVIQFRFWLRHNCVLPFDYANFYQRKIQHQQVVVNKADLQKGSIVWYTIYIRASRGQHIKLERPHRIRSVVIPPPTSPQILAANSFLLRSPLTTYVWELHFDHTAIVGLINVKTLSVCVWCVFSSSQQIFSTNIIL